MHTHAHQAGFIIPTGVVWRYVNMTTLIYSLPLNSKVLCRSLFAKPCLLYNTIYVFTHDDHLSPRPPSYQT